MRRFLKVVGFVVSCKNRHGVLTVKGRYAPQQKGLQGGGNDYCYNDGDVVSSRSFDQPWDVSSVIYPAYVSTYEPDSGL